MKYISFILFLICLFILVFFALKNIESITLEMPDEELDFIIVYTNIFPDEEKYDYDKAIHFSSKEYYLTIKRNEYILYPRKEVQDEVSD